MGTRLYDKVILEPAIVSVKLHVYPVIDVPIYNGIICRDICCPLSRIITDEAVDLSVF